MFEWIGNAVSKFTGWLGSGAASAIEWILGGLADMITIIINAANGIWSVFEALWSLGSSFVGALASMFRLVFPFAPEPVANVITAGLIAVLIIGIVKVVRK